MLFFFTVHEDDRNPKIIGTKEELKLLRHETVSIKQDLNSVKAEIGEMKNVLMALTERLNNSLKEKGKFFERN